MSKINKIADILVQNLEQLQEVASFEIMGMHKQRVFNDATGSKGEQLQYKSEYYKRKREREGRQTNNIDFEMTGKLRNALKVGFQNDNIVYGVDGSQRDKISNQELLKFINERFDDFMLVSDEEIKTTLEKVQDFFKKRAIQSLKNLWDT